MQFTNTKDRYGFIAILLHWLMAILIIGLLALGLYMKNLSMSIEKLKLYGFHKEYGLLALALVILRFMWRIVNSTPHLSLPLWEKIAARSVHWAFYICMFALPITGWLITSASGLPASFFGLGVLPNLIAPNEVLRSVFEKMHQYLGYACIALITLHISAALKHHFINKDNILRRIFS